jgi:hypothetical protein
VDDDVDVVHVDASGGDIGGDQDRQLPGGERGERLRIAWRRSPWAAAHALFSELLRAVGPAFVRTKMRAEFGRSGRRRGSSSVELA